jgi:hypothetical protein
VHFLLHYDNLKKGIVFTSLAMYYYCMGGRIMTEKRASERQPYPEEMELETTATGGVGTYHQVHCLDISQGGLGLSTSHILRENQIVKISLPVKGFAATVPVLAEVSWVMADNNRYRAGVRYLI